MEKYLKGRAPIIIARNQESFDTWGLCPNCNREVISGPGRHDEKCPYCGLLLDWGVNNGRD